MHAEPRGVNLLLFYNNKFTETHCEPFEPEPDNTGVGMVAVLLLIYNAHWHKNKQTKNLRVPDP